MADDINHPLHYTGTEIPFECIEIAECMSYPLGCAFKYVFRGGYKDLLDKDLNKALWYLDRLIWLHRPGVLVPLPKDHLETLIRLSEYSYRACVLLKLCSNFAKDYLTARGLINNWLMSIKETENE